MKALKFRKVLIADERYESAGVFDVNNDGIPDIISGAYWYEGPDFKRKHFIGDVPASGEYFDDFSTIPMDVNGDGYTDYITGGWWGETLRWNENPGAENKEWQSHIIAKTGSIETTCAWDIDGDGIPEIIPNTPGGPLVAYKLITDSSGKGTGKFSSQLLYDGKQQHGLGFGDVSGRGRGDFVFNHGWLESPETTYEGKWILHPDFELFPSGGASIPILVVDVNRDGLNDIIAGCSHGYGLYWWEQKMSVGGKRTWDKHPIDPYNSQYHNMLWVDIDGDGECELITGKRYRAHCGLDPGANDNVGIYYFKWNGESFSKQVVDYGEARIGKGCGIHFAVSDLRGTGRLDIVAPGKDGLYVFFNEE